MREKKATASALDTENSSEIKGESLIIKTTSTGSDNNLAAGGLLSNIKDVHVSENMAEFITHSTESSLIFHILYSIFYSTVLLIITQYGISTAHYTTRSIITQYNYLLLTVYYIFNILLQFITLYVISKDSTLIFTKNFPSNKNKIISIFILIISVILTGIFIGLFSTDIFISITISIYTGISLSYSIIILIDIILYTICNKYECMYNYKHMCNKKLSLIYYINIIISIIITVYTAYIIKDTLYPNTVSNSQIG
ncbi:hypothetical protein NEPAR06_0447 [Nematocida parisii]|uniref:Uncharacterized protein n=1 Tax=Nematocida parisii (strain ERTm3) TaxID=935791 RepID=I3EIB8_NEMP3|nr:uncharacterized protein NEPG_01822 [Nematocida parisii ERTm1]EIJ88965.1 hypothetical protein NEQG_00784 [Nematocida parisii ERTm3]KAI5146359.1 hypothetical protein NEPAR07_2321 [Nematocida parisii]EIJ93480.1 hypothetical protein NEPG_01822 [Nematocida parisii ERTm1]KAI5153439.1 hypothetical protein NEPAR06_0447 [Nematocida parisii]KAI5156227.1 hypothetical protein NEPAR05_0404 [Nematocida parisii]|eukprot:XP_013059650.1 hypothetical protein NEPG_01822 [Nematocida parisii ERTm1]